MIFVKLCLTFTNPQFSICEDIRLGGQRMGMKSTKLHEHTLVNMIFTHKHYEGHGISRGCFVLHCVINLL